MPDCYSCPKPKYGASHVSIRGNIRNFVLTIISELFRPSQILSRSPHHDLPYKAPPLRRRPAMEQRRRRVENWTSLDRLYRGRLGIVILLVTRVSQSSIRPIATSRRRPLRFTKITTWQSNPNKMDSTCRWTDRVPLRSKRLQMRRCC